MPRGDGTGPLGFGPMTGRSVGFCAGFGVPGYLNPMGIRYGFDFGRGRGFRRTYRRAPFPVYLYQYYGYPAYPAADITEQDEKEALKMQAKYLEKQLQQIKKRLSELDEDKE